MSLAPPPIEKVKNRVISIAGSLSVDRLPDFFVLPGQVPTYLCDEVRTGMDGYEAALTYLPAALRHPLEGIPGELRKIVQELRLRAGMPVLLSSPQGEWAVDQRGEAVLFAGQGFRTDWLRCDRGQLADIFQALCEYSVHTHQQELRQGYISTKNGCRAGVAGTAVVENGEIVSLRAVTSLCIRVARPHEGCSADLARRLTAGGRIRSALICGEPSSGKSSLLRDLARQLSQGLTGRCYRVTVVDERGELSGVGVPGGRPSLEGCDVLLYAPKPQGIQQAVRCLAPDVVLFDELGTEEETVAVTAGLHSGVAAISSAHCRDKASLLKRPAIRRALENGAFEYVVMLLGRGQPGKIAGIYETEEWLHEDGRIIADCPDRLGNGTYGGGRTPPASRQSGTAWTSYGTDGGSDSLYGGSGRRIAGIG